MMQSATLASGGGFSIIPAIPDLIWGSLAFVIVAIAIYKFGWPSFSAMLDERSEKIDEGLRAAQEARAEVADQQAQLTEKIRQAQREAAGIREHAQDNAKAIVHDAQTKARDEAEGIIANAQRRIDADTAAAMSALEGDVGKLATELAGRIVGEAITDEAMARRVIDRFLDELEATAPTTLAHKSED
ncbi:F0F1 ATP synthase subunit B [Trueperella sp. LYQ143]|uniref:F0F1 ATP synthase subunit B n=1 Tax=unclassified Trueperella TaxID=2630174 RepID=UPI003982DF34